MDYPYYSTRKSTKRFVETSSPEPEPSRAVKTETMSSWLQHQASSHQAQIVGTAILSGLAVAGTILGVQAVRRRVAIEDLKASIPNIDEDHPAETVFQVIPSHIISTSF